jgi:hypothetical protein
MMYIWVGWECNCVSDTFYPLRGSPETTCPNVSSFIFAWHLYVHTIGFQCLKRRKCEKTLHFQKFCKENNLYE